MARIRIESIKAGMTVAADVKNIDGMLLLPKGATLGERQVGILQAWGVGEVEIDASEAGEDSSEPLAQLAPEVLTRLREETMALFWETDETNPVFAELLKQLVLRRARKLTGL